MTLKDGGHQDWPLWDLQITLNPNPSVNSSKNKSGSTGES